MAIGKLEVFLRVTQMKTDLHNHFQSHQKVQVVFIISFNWLYRAKISLNSSVRPVIKEDRNGWLLSLFRIIRKERSMISQETAYASINEVVFFYYRITLWFLLITVCVVANIFHNESAVGYLTYFTSNHLLHQWWD